ncbi:SpoIIE family protein phosphatase [Aestuariirhabdus sp. Z084]|uniref:SpoIIE family protein phosphatase n=1 Tax=Aestuariirhabdus haliotis TaxID=2918751 RepID=UPI00201B3DA4|nr:SpoIIE family protein phosphatase [Aestuariirhabdus haliotis]MCL6414636.1 SpoIIE family protein phosphatase [Aestuariirhabdus haliotis]MCL6418382.1 SpoIIE family protein phosphatase [Aestuariirhabdus haliotis]
MAPAGKRLLVIDDETAVRESIAAHLEGSGFTVFQAENGHTGLELIKQQRPEVVICDLRMPHMAGLSLLNAIKDAAPDTPVIVVSGASATSDVVEALRLGASDYLIKPITDLEVLEHSVLRAFEQLQLQRDNLAYRESLEAAIKSLQQSLAELQEDQRAGRQVQQKLLPQSPQEVAGFRFEYYICPSLYLSGDFVDIIPLDEHRFGFYLADVSGHGASSAFVTILLKHMTFRLRREYRDRGGDIPVRPSEILDSLNRGLLNTDLGKHVTMFGGVIDTRENRMTYSVGGHFPLPIIATADGVKFLSGSGLPVGIFDHAEYDDHELSLPEEFTLVAFSDGILDRLSDESLEEKEKALLSTISENRKLDGIKSAFGLDNLKESPDDIAVLVLSRNR